MKFLYLLISIIPLSAFSQFGSVQLIDSSSASTGITKIASGDLNGDGYQDIIISNGFQIGKVGFYLNDKNGGFLPNVNIDSIAYYAESVATGDLSNNGQTDIVSIARHKGVLAWYPNNNGSFTTRIVLDTNVIHLNEVVVADFDSKNGDDLVVIGQHSIDYFRNDGSGNFSKEEILTTSTSPNILECLSLKVADMNGDGHLDLVTGETLGGVIYFNSGNGIFTPQAFTPQLITIFVHPFDVNGDGTTDVVLQTSNRQLSWYSNDGNGNMTFEADLFKLTIIKSMEAIDLNNDGHLDIYTAYSTIDPNGKVVAFLNDGNGNFGNEVIFHQINSTFIYEVGLMDIDNDSDQDFIWASISLLAYQENTTATNISDLSPQAPFSIYPNPASETVMIEFHNPREVSLEILDMNGGLLEKHDTIERRINIDVSKYPGGTYFFRVSSENDIYTKKVVR